MTDVLALIPARTGSKSIPNKNFTPIIHGKHPVQLAVEAIRPIGATIWLSSDAAITIWDVRDGSLFKDVNHLMRPPELATDTSAMIDVVKHALGEIPGPPEQIILLVQPTQVLRQPKHLRAAIEILQSSEWVESVVSVVEVPAMYHQHWQLGIAADGGLIPCSARGWELAPRRQVLGQTWIRDGTVYGFRRRTVSDFGSIYGDGLGVQPLIIPPEETAPLDTLEEWQNAERRLRALSEVP